MARKPRLFVSGATYHVYCRVARGEFVFDDPHEAEEFVEATIVRSLGHGETQHVAVRYARPQRFAEAV